MKNKNYFVETLGRVLDHSQAYLAVAGLLISGYALVSAVNKTPKPIQEQTQSEPVQEVKQKSQLEKIVDNVKWLAR